MLVTFSLYIYWDGNIVYMKVNHRIFFHSSFFFFAFYLTILNPFLFIYIKNRETPQYPRPTSTKGALTTMASFQSSTIVKFLKWAGYTYIMYVLLSTILCMYYLEPHHFRHHVPLERSICSESTACINHKVKTKHNSILVRFQPTEHGLSIVSENGTASLLTELLLSLL